MRSIEAAPKAKGGRDAIVGWAAVAAAAGAVFAWAACCVLPLGLALAGVGFSAVAVAANRSWLTLFAALVLAGGWWLAWRRSRECRIDCRPPSRLNIALLGVASLLLLIALAWPQAIEPRLLALIRGARG